MASCDVLIVGGGPAGLAAAIALRLRGVGVLVADALFPPIDKACGEGLLPDAQDELAKLGISIPAGDGAIFDGIAFLSERTQVNALFARGVGIGIRRKRLHSILAEHASQVGARLAWGSRVTLRPGGRVELNGAERRYGYLVGADGQSSRVRQWSGLDAASHIERRFGMRRHFRIPQGNRLWSRSSRRLVEVYWGDSGQAYITPVTEGEICVATVARSASAGMDGVLRDLPSLKRWLDSAVAASALRGSLTTTRKLRRVTARNVALTGDASGSVDAVTGEGLALAFRQASLLAQAIAADDLTIYESAHPRILRRPRMMAKMMLTMDRSPWLRDRALAMLAHDPKLLGRLLAVHVGDRPLGSCLLRDGARIGWRLLMPPAPAA